MNYDNDDDNHDDDDDNIDNDNKGSHKFISFDKLGILSQPAWPPSL